MTLPERSIIGPSFGSADELIRDMGTFDDPEPINWENVGAELCHGECGQPIRPVGPPASLIENLAGRRLYCLPCLLATCARPIEEVWPDA